MTDLVRICPNCASERPATEISCQAEYQGVACNWSLLDVPLAIRGAPQHAVELMPPAEEAGRGQLCVNGHSVGDGDLLCPLCNADVASAVPTPPSPEVTVIDGWRVVQRLDTHSAIHERFIVETAGGERR